LQARDWAEQILFGRNLSDKLLEPGRVLDTHPGSRRSVPSEPGRPKSLAFLGKKARFPTSAELETDEGRGRVLHFFANHELLALELMALALLRFPDAPPLFRKSIIGTMVDEQRHLRMYMDRMEELGVELGALPVSDFFWRALKDMRDPADYAAQMSLTLEQANLDFAVHYRDLFGAMGDDVTSDLLGVVYRDEISHVRHGVKWLGRFDPDRPLWDAWTSRLELPLSPSRARGIGFDRQGRRRAGLQDDLIDRVAVAGGSRGRVPDLYFFDPGAEGFTTGEPPRIARVIGRDLAPLMSVVAHRDDAVWVREIPEPSRLAALAQRGVDVPQFVQRVSDLPQGRAKRMHPWGASEHARDAANALGGTLPQHDRTDTLPFYEVAQQAGCVAISPSPLESVDDLHAALSRLAEQRHDQAVIKAAGSTAGRGLIQLATSEAPPKAALRAVRRGGATIEPWLDRVADFSTQLDLSTGVRVLGTARFLTTPAGQYLGHYLQRPFDDIPLAARPEWFRGGNPLHRVQKAATAIGDALFAQGMRGPVGIDFFLVRDSAGLSLQFAEINARLTMGRVALGLKRLLAPTTTAIWLHVPAKLTHGVELPTSQWQDGKLVSGIWNPAPGAEAIHTYVVAGESAESVWNTVPKAWRGRLAQAS